MQTEMVLIYLLNDKNLYQNVWSTLFCCSGGFLPENLPDPTSPIPWEQQQLSKAGKQFLLQTLWAQLRLQVGLRSAATETIFISDISPGWRSIFSMGHRHPSDWDESLNCSHSWAAQAGRVNHTAQPLTSTSSILSSTGNAESCPGTAGKNPVQKSLRTTKLGRFKCQLKKWEGGKNTSGKACGAQESPGSSILPAMGYLHCSLGKDMARNTSRTDQLLYSHSLWLFALQDYFPLSEEKDLDLKGKRLLKILSLNIAKEKALGRF